MSLASNFRAILRSLMRTPGYTLTCVAVLALGIGANAAIFSLVYSIVLKDLPYREPGQLVFVWERFLAMPEPFSTRMHVARRNYEEWKRQNTVFSGMAAYRSMDLNETGVEQPRRVPVAAASPELFPLLGVTAGAGRLFTAQESTPGNDRVAVIADAYLRKRFGGERNAVGQSITLGGAAYTVIGVLPAWFHLPSTHEGSDQQKPEVWVPLSRAFRTADDERRRELFVAARLKPGATVEQARSEMNAINERLAKSDPELNTGWKINVFPLHEEDTAPKLRQTLYVLFGAVGFLLLIACANLANLTLARATLRAREMGIRLALGASRAQIAAQLLTESLMVSLAGAAAGLVIANWCLKLMLSLKPSEIMRPDEIQVSWPVFGFSVLVSVLTALLFGLAPALGASRTNLNTSLKSGGAGGASAARVRSRQFLITVEVALAVVLLAGAGLMIRSFHALVTTGIGFDTTRLMTADIELPERRYPDGASRSRLYRQVLERTRTLPGVQSAAIIDNLPLHRVSMSNFYIAGRPDPPMNALPIADMAHATPEYFRVIGLRLLSGRFFTEADLKNAERQQDTVAIVNQSFARKFFDGESPLGKKLLNPSKKRASEIIGVVADYRPMGAENGTRPQIFWPDLNLPAATLLVRSQSSPELLGQALRSAIWSADRDLPLNRVEPMTYYVDDWQSQRKFTVLLLSSFAALALTLAMIGIYGVLSNLVASRVREIGIRLAIGATPGDIGRLVVSQSMLPVMIGLGLGLAGSLALARFMAALLFQVHPRDPLSFTLAALAIVLISPLAILVPLRRALKVECTVALRQE